MAGIETIDGSNWEAFIRHDPAAVLVLARSACPACAAWTEEISRRLSEDPQALGAVRVGKMLLDQPGLADFKRANPWLASEVDVVPFNVLYREGQRVKSFPGGGIDRLEKRLSRLLG